MFNPKNYKIKFDPRGLSLFLIIMVPSFIWARIPAPNDILRAQSVTPITDAAGSVFQALMVASLCMLRNVQDDDSANKAFLFGTRAAIILYFIGWAFYYTGTVNAAVILDLCIIPCLAFILFSAAHKNGFTLVFAVLFMVLHTAGSVVNFIV